MSWVAFGDLEVCPFRPTDSEEFKSTQRLFEPARMLGIEVPTSMQLLAEEVIE